MATPVIQASFNSGEWAPALYARVDLQKYHSAAALLRNFFVDYRGGATTRPGTKYILQARSNTIRLIDFKASFAVTYILEFGPGYIRFYNNGAPVLENAKSITSAAAGPPEVFTSTTHGYANNDWLFISGSYYIVAGATANTFTLTDLFGNAITTNPFTLPTNAQRVYTLLTSPYQAADLFAIKYAQDVNLLILTHPNYPPYQLVLNSATNWTLSKIVFGSSIAAPTGLSVTTTTAGSYLQSYIVTAVDVNGQESSAAISPNVAFSPTALATNTVSWSPVTGALSYNVYRTIASASGAIPSGSQYGFLGSCTGTAFIDTNLTPNFAIAPPILENPFQGSGVTTVTLTAQGNNYATVPTVTFTAAPPGGVTATGYCTLQCGTLTLSSPGTGYVVGQVINMGFGLAFTVTSVDGAGRIQNGYRSSPGLVSSGNVPLGFVDLGHGNGVFPQPTPAVFALAWFVNAIYLSNPGSGYAIAPSVAISGGGGAAATTTIGAQSSGNPSACGFGQQRLFLGGPIASPSQINMSQPGSPFNFNVTFPPQADNAIQETLSNTVLNSVKSFVPVSAGVLVFTDRGAWLINGGSPGSAFSALTLVANPQAYSGSSDLPPIVTPNDILYVQSKGSIVRDLAFNFYLNNYVGTDISILSSHLFYGFTLSQWAWAEEPFKLLWAVRNDGALLSLTFIKEQELVAWAHSDTLGSFTTIASVNESTIVGNVDAIYVGVQRQIQGQLVTYIERMVELYYPNDYRSAWQVDAGIGYNGSAATTFSGAQHLGGQVVTGLADGVVINFTMPTNGTFVFGPGGTAGLTAIASASIVTVGLAFTPQLTTLPLDLGQPTVQGKRKSVKGLAMKVANTLGLSAGRNLNTVVPLADTTLIPTAPNIGTMSNLPVNGLVTGDVRLIVDPQWDVYGQYSIVQSNPYPASILGVIPEIEVGDDE